MILKYKLNIIDENLNKIKNLFVLHTSEQQQRHCFCNLTTFVFHTG